MVKEQEQEEEMEKIVEEKIIEKKKEMVEMEKNDEIEFKTVMGRNVHSILSIFRSRHVERNELFVPGRMAYLIDLEDENAETDIPTTIIRSKAEIPTGKYKSEHITIRFT